ncbi:hypothetical protein H0H92_000929 [Tricholoma furcatifolium]|nr:hypothetical protein H0H92_000929 [Tricholoma furcatifolium]
MADTPSLAKLTSISTLTLSLLLERQRLHAISPSPQPHVPLDNSSGAGTPQAHTLHLTQITKNLARLKAGILALESEAEQSVGNGKAQVTGTGTGKAQGRDPRMDEALRLLRAQHERMRGMLGEDVCRDAGVESLDDQKQKQPPPPSIALPPPDTFVPPISTSPVYTPYTDDPHGDSPSETDNGILLQTQRRMMDGQQLTPLPGPPTTEQDLHLDALSHSITRQHHISLQINDELDVHHGLLSELDTDVDRTASRLARARRGLERVARGVGGNGEHTHTGVLSPGLSYGRRTVHDFEEPKYAQTSSETRVTRRAVWLRLTWQWAPGAWRSGRKALGTGGRWTVAGGRTD